jgi:hypothetical protein
VREGTGPVGADAGPLHPLVGCANTRLLHQEVEPMMRSDRSPSITVGVLACEPEAVVS